MQVYRIFFLTNAGSVDQQQQQQQNQTEQKQNTLENKAYWMK